METKKCLQCNETLPIDHFEPRSKVKITKKERIRVVYRRTKCKSCRSGKIIPTDIRHPRYIKPEDKIIDPDNSIPKSTKHRINGYGLTIKDFNLLRKSQKNECYICKTKFEDIKSINIDHCHEANKVRGLLCWGCNTSIGRLKDNIENLKRAMEYLQNPPAYKIIQSEGTIKRIIDPFPYTGTTLPVLYIKKEKPVKLPVYKKKPKQEYLLFNKKGQLVTKYLGIPDVLENLGVSRYSFHDLLRGKQKYLKGEYVLKLGKMIDVN